MCFNSWCKHDSFGSHCGQHKSRPFPFFHVEQLQAGSSHVITPLLHVQILHGWLCGETRSPSGISMSSNMQPAKINRNETERETEVVICISFVRFSLYFKFRAYVLTQTAWFGHWFAGISWIIANAFKMTIIVDTWCRWMATVRTVVAFIYVMAFIVMRFIAGLALAIIPTGHIHTVRGRFACVQASCTLVQISFTRGTNVTHTASTCVWWRANTTIQTHLLAHRLNCATFTAAHPEKKKDFQNKRNVNFNMRTKQIQNSSRPSKSRSVHLRLHCMPSPS